MHLAVETLADEDLLHYNDERWASGPSALWTGLHVSGAGLQALGNNLALRNPPRFQNGVFNRLFKWVHNSKRGVGGAA